MGHQDKNGKNVWQMLLFDKIHGFGKGVQILNMDDDAAGDLSEANLSFLVIRLLTLSSVEDGNLSYTNNNN